MSNNLVPKLTIKESTESLAIPQNWLTVIWIIGTSESGTANVVRTISSVYEAEALFGSKTIYGANLVSMIKKAFSEGAALVKAVSIWAPVLASATSGSQGTLTADSLAGASTVTVASATIYTTGDEVYLGLSNANYDKEEKLIVQSWSGTTLTFTTPLKFDHYTGEVARIITPKVASDYTSAITAMEQDEDKNIVICESTISAVETAMITMVTNSYNNYNTPCVYIQAPSASDSESSIVTKAQGFNNSNVILVYPLLTEFNGKTSTSGDTAAAIAGAIAWNGVPKLNHNFTDLVSFGGVKSKITNIDSLISWGVTPIELKFSTIHIVRFVTSKTTTSGVPDYTWREGSIRLNVNFIEKEISKSLQMKFLQKWNTSTVREAIKQDIISFLNIYSSNDILVADERTNTPAFRDPVIAIDPSDSSKINVAVQISPWKPLNFIDLSFKVYI